MKTGVCSAGLGFQTEGQGQGFGSLEVCVWCFWHQGVQILGAVRQVGLQEVRDKELHEFRVWGFRWCPCAPSARCGIAAAKCCVFLHLAR